MATIKSFTSLEQSRKLADILPLESADMYWDLLSKSNYAKVNNIGTCLGRTCVYAWSLASLLDVLPKGYSIGRRTTGKYYVCMTHIEHKVSEYDNPVDACVAMIKLLHEQKLL